MDSKASSESKPYSSTLSTLSYAIHCSFISNNYINTSPPDYTYYVRKRNPTTIYDSVASVPSTHYLLRGTAI